MRTTQARSRVATRRGPSRLQIMLAAGWMMASLLIGGALNAQALDERAASPSDVTAITQ